MVLSEEEEGKGEERREKEGEEKGKEEKKEEREVVAKNQIQAVFMAFFTILPAFLLSGFVFPRRMMPEILYLAGWLVPLTYYLEILRGIILRGAGILELWDETAALFVFGMVIMTLATIRFQKRLG